VDDEFEQAHPVRLGRSMMSRGRPPMCAMRSGSAEQPHLLYAYETTRPRTSPVCRPARSWTPGGSIASVIAFAHRIARAGPSLRACPQPSG
jgi:hypothetical protein